MLRKVTIFGIVNLTRDSFSDGGLYLDPQDALDHARRLVVEGADVIDLGAESTHPDAEPVPPDTQIERLTPVVQMLRAHGVRISIDTYRPEVMRAMLALGAEFINDVTGLRDPESVAVLRDAPACIVLMHSRSRTPRAQRQPVNPVTVVDEIVEFFRERLDALAEAGIEPRRLILDPGMGLFLGDDPRASLVVLRELPRVVALGRPVLVSTSRKSFIGRVLADGEQMRPVHRRLFGTLTTEVVAVQHGAAYIRTHQPGPLRDALRMLDAIEQAPRNPQEVSI